MVYDVGARHGGNSTFCVPCVFVLFQSAGDAQAPHVLSQESCISKPRRGDMFIESVLTANQQAPSGAARVCVGLQDYGTIDTVGELSPANVLPACLSGLL